MHKSEVASSSLEETVILSSCLEKRKLCFVFTQIDRLALGEIT